MAVSGYRNRGKVLHPAVANPELLQRLPAGRRIARRVQQRHRRTQGDRGKLPLIDAEIVLLGKTDLAVDQHLHVQPVGDRAGVAVEEIASPARAAGDEIHRHLAALAAGQGHLHFAVLRNHDLARPGGRLAVVVKGAVADRAAPAEDDLRGAGQQIVVNVEGPRHLVAFKEAMIALTRPGEHRRPGPAPCGRPRRRWRCGTCRWWPRSPRRRPATQGTIRP